MKGFKIPRALPDHYCTLCEYIALIEGDKLKPCTVDPKECVLMQLGKVSKEYPYSFTPIPSENGMCPKPLKEVKEEFWDDV